MIVLDSENESYQEFKNEKNIFVLFFRSIYCNRNMGLIFLSIFFYIIYCRELFDEIN